MYIFSYFFFTVNHLYYKNKNKQGEADICDVTEKSVYDLYLTKYWGITYATKAAISVMYVDKIIMAKPAGGPKPKENKDWDNDDQKFINYISD